MTLSKQWRIKRERRDKTPNENNIRDENTLDDILSDRNDEQNDRQSLEERTIARVGNCQQCTHSKKVIQTDGDMYKGCKHM